MVKVAFSFVMATQSGVTLILKQCNVVQQLVLLLSQIPPEKLWVRISLSDEGNNFSCDNVEKLKIFYTNIDQFLNEKYDLEMAIAGTNPDIILISKILPKAYCNTIPAARLSLTGYCSFYNFDPTTAPLNFFHTMCGYLRF